MRGREVNILYLNRMDVVGRRFNGFDLHLQLQEMGHDASCIVRDKISDDATTFVHNRDMICTDKDAVHTIGGELTNLLVSSPLFLDADILHMHIVLDCLLDFHLLPLIAMLKPIVWTMHDPWLMGGHCIYPGECNKWKTHCHDCGTIRPTYSLDIDRTAFHFENKKQVVQNSQIDFIVASEWMCNRAEQSPVLKGKRIHKIPFGIDQVFFKPRNSVEVRRELGIPGESKVLFLRQERLFKRPDIIRKAIDDLKNDHKKIDVLVVGTDDEFYPPDETVSVHYFGWLTDDRLLVKLYQACDLFLMPSDHEAFGVMAIEAMSCGKMVLVLEGTALPSVVHAPECGVATTAAEYGCELRRLLLDPDELRIRGQKSLEYAKLHYNQSIYLQRLLSLYREVISNFTLTEEAKAILEQLNKYSRHEKQPDTLSGMERVLYRVAPSS